MVDYGTKILRFSGNTAPRICVYFQTRLSMAKPRDFFLAGFLALMFTMLFYHQSIGLNLMIFEFVLLSLICYFTPVKKITVSGWVLTASVVVTAIFTLVHASAFVITMNVISLLLWAGWLLLPGGRSLVSIAGLALGNLAYSPVNTLNQLMARTGQSDRSRHRLRQAVYFVLPVILILFFLMIYSASNPYFSKIVEDLLRFPDQWLNRLLAHVNFSLLGVLFLGIWTAVIFVFRKQIGKIPAWDENAPETLQRQRRTRSSGGFRMLALKSEYRAGLFLLVVLNLLILLQNVLDIWFVWFNFEWNGQYLRQFVHEGTYLLILSILISISIILWLYRGNLNFLKGNGFLKWLSYAWLVQNMVLIISVAIRNGWYIYHYALAYKRIGVFVFLALTFIGIITVMIKLAGFRTSFYLLRVNAMAAFILLVMTSLVNWDVLIARYNFSRYETAFVHLDWLCTLSDKTLPYLDKTKEELEKIRQVRDRNFSFDHRYMSPAEYHEIIRQRKRDFILDYEHRGILSFNLADYRAYKSLKKGNKSTTIPPGR
jgi:hypothetical protein